MKILIAGGNSAVASALVPVLRNLGEVVTAGRRNCDLALDINDPIAEIKIPAGTDVVVCTAAHFGGNTADDMLNAESTNVLGSMKLCAAAKESGVKHFVLISSIFALMDKHSPYFSVYALSKKHADELCDLYCAKHELPLTILRPAQIYGSDEGYRRHQPFFYSLADKAEKGEDISLYGKNDALRNYIHIDDLCLIISGVVEKRITGTYTCGGIENISYSRIAKAALSAFSSKAALHKLEDKPDVADNAFEKDNTLYDLLGFYPAITIEQGMKMIAQNRKQKA